MIFPRCFTITAEYMLAQITRHRIASFSVQSQRYVRLDDFRYVIPPEIEPLLTRRKLYTAPASAAEREPLGSRYLLCAAPILVHGDIEGGVLLHGTLREAAPNAETVRAAATAAEFLARWMEE